MTGITVEDILRKRLPGAEVLVARDVAWRTNVIGLRAQFGVQVTIADPPPGPDWDEQMTRAAMEVVREFEAKGREVFAGLIGDIEAEYQAKIDRLQAEVEALRNYARQVYHEGVRDGVRSVFDEDDDDCDPELDAEREDAPGMENDR